MNKGVEGGKHLVSAVRLAGDELVGGSFNGKCISFLLLWQITTAILS